ncbi:MAG: hypothetical protein WA432_03810 [Candidatus Babeliaceae bacterium]
MNKKKLVLYFLVVSLMNNQLYSAFKQEKKRLTKGKILNRLQLQTIHVPLGSIDRINLNLPMSNVHFIYHDQVFARIIIMPFRRDVPLTVYEEFDTLNIGFAGNIFEIVDFNIWLPRGPLLELRGQVREFEAASDMKFKSQSVHTLYYNL